MFLSKTFLLQEILVRRFDIAFGTSNMLNKKSEFISKCRHINKRLLIKVKDDSND